MQHIDRVADTTTPANAPRPIFVRGIMQRSGTNYLQDLLHLHPDVQGQEHVYEDHLFAESDLLVRFADLTTSAWRGPATESSSARDDLLGSLGDALAAFLAQGITTPWFSTKMPSVDGLDVASLLFPDAPILIVVRDGRAVVESAVTTFRVSFDREAARWADGARAVIQLSRSGSPNVMVVRYEDMVSNVRDSMTAVLEHVGLDVTTYPFDAAQALPFRGSSELAKGDGVHWEQIECDSINPAQRGTGLSAEQRAVFDRLAGDELEALGYRRDGAAASAGVAAGRITLPSRERVAWQTRRVAGRWRHVLRRHI